MKVEEPALALDAIEGRVPFDGLAHFGDGAHDQRVETAPDVALPARHARDVGLDGRVAVGLRDLRVAACEESRLCALAKRRLRRQRALLGHLRNDSPGAGLLCDLHRRLERFAGHCVYSRTVPRTSVRRPTSW